MIPKSWTVSWNIHENKMDKMDDVGYPHFGKPPYWGYTGPGTNNHNHNQHQSTRYSWGEREGCRCPGHGSTLGHTEIANGWLSDKVRRNIAEMFKHFPNILIATAIRGPSPNAPSAAIQARNISSSSLSWHSSVCGEFRSWNPTQEPLPSVPHPNNAIVASWGCVPNFRRYTFRESAIATRCPC